MKTLESLEKSGYSVRLDGQEIKLTYQGQGVPDAAQVRPLLDDLRQHKPEALQFLRKQDTERIFHAAIDELSKGWKGGLLEHTQRHHPEIWQTIQEAESCLDVVWVQTLTGHATLADFEEAVSSWKDAYLLTIKEHRTRTCDECEATKQFKCAEFWGSRRIQ